MSTSGAACCWEAYKMSDGSMVELVVSLKFLFLSSPIFASLSTLLSTFLTDFTSLHLQFFINELINFSPQTLCSVFSWRFVAWVWLLATWSWWIFADWCNRWCSSSYRHIWESRADGCFPLCFSMLHPIMDLLFESTQVVLYKSSNLSSSVSCASGCNIELYCLCTSNILKMSSSCCTWSQTDSKFLKEYSIPSTALDFLIILLFNLERFFSSSSNWYAIYLGVGLVFLLPNSLKADWFSVAVFDLPSQTSVTELNIGLTSLIYVTLRLWSVSVQLHTSVWHQCHPQQD